MRSFQGNVEWTVSSFRIWGDRVHAHMKTGHSYYGNRTAVSNYAKIIKISSHGQPGLLWKPRAVCFPRKLMEGKWKYLETSYYRRQQESLDTHWKPKTHQGQDDTGILKTTTQNTMRTILIPLPRSYGINSGNHISPGKQNCARFPMSPVSGIYLTARRH